MQAVIEDNLSRFFREDGRTAILPIDHGCAIPVPGLEKPGELIESLSDTVDGWVVNLGVADNFRDELADTGLCLRADIYKPDNPAGSYAVFDAEDALEVGANAVMHMLYPGHANEEAITRDCARTIRECASVGIPTIVETLPKGLGLPEEYTMEQIGFAVRMAAELGAHVVKTAYPTGADPEEFAAIIEACWVPVVVLGGAAMGDDEALLKMVSDSMAAGAAGVAIGRNVWQHENPARISAAMASEIHGVEI